ncbi:MAG: KTSC domain-containing protein [Cytophagaceae bacterium]|nr:KTSC domain-containing protein [Cytophagaceae bacterium]
MKKVADYRKLLNVDKTVELKELKSIYRGLMKEWHPDKFSGNDEAKLDAEEKSKEYIEAYNFLVSINAETLELNKEEYEKTISEANVLDYNYKARILTVNFSDGSVYEYFEVPSNVYNKLLNSNTPARFVRRNICTEFTYRKATNPTS